MSRFLVLFDAPPAVDPTAWMKRCCAAANLFLADLDSVSKVMGADPVAQKAILASNKRHEDPALAVHYAAALEKVAAGKARVAVHSVSWFLFGQQPSVCVLDYDNLELERAKGKALGLTDAQYDELVAKARAAVEARVKAHLPGERVLVLPKGATDEAKATAAAAFVKRWEDARP